MDRRLQQSAVHTDLGHIYSNAHLRFQPRIGHSGAILPLHTAGHEGPTAVAHRNQHADKNPHADQNEYCGRGHCNEDTDEDEHSGRGNQHADPNSVPNSDTHEYARGRGHQHAHPDGNLASDGDGDATTAAGMRDHPR